MRSWLAPLCATLLATSALAADHTETGYQTPGTSPPTGEGGCGTLLMNSDTTYENGYAWKYGGIVAPYYGAFAEQYRVDLQPVCSLVLDLTQIGTQDGQTLDAYVWDSYQDRPGLVINVAVGKDPGPVALWPSISRHVISMPADDCPVGDAWVGYWGNWPLATEGWFVGADLDGFGGMAPPATNIAPGIGYPTGWNNVSIVWGPTQALGIGLEYNGFCDIFDTFVCCLPDGSCYVTIDRYDCAIQGGSFFASEGCDPDPCGPTPVEDSSWGEIKSLYSTPTR